MVMSRTVPIPTTHLFQPLDDALIALLQSLTPDEWNYPVSAKHWTVKDVAAHLLDGNVRALSMVNDKYFGVSPGDIDPSETLIDYLNRLNAEWVLAMKRVSPRRLIQLLEMTGREYCRFISELEPFEQAVFSVGWAGEDVSENWFHVAREYTEKWHHQQQIRDAVNKPGILNATFYKPFLDTFMRALPHTYRHTMAPRGTVVRITVTGEGGGDWHIIKNDSWEMAGGISAAPSAHTTIDGNAAWKLFSKNWRRADVPAYVTIAGDTALGDVVLDMVSVMA